MFLLKKLPHLTSIITLLYAIWVIWFFTQASSVLNYHQYVYGITFTALFACFLLAVIVSNRNYLIKLGTILLPYLAWIGWFSTQNLDQNDPDLFGTILVIGIMAFIAATFTMANNLTRPDAALIANGEKATATILAIQDSHITVQNTQFAVNLTLEVHSQSRGVFTAQVQTLVSRVQIPRPGDKVNVLFDPSNPDNIAVV